jgi:hypothetical protein
MVEGISEAFIGIRSTHDCAERGEDPAMLFVSEDLPTDETSLLEIEEIRILINFIVIEFDKFMELIVLPRACWWKILIRSGLQGLGMSACDLLLDLLFSHQREHMNVSQRCSCWAFPLLQMHAEHDGVHSVGKFLKIKDDIFIVGKFIVDRLTVTSVITSVLCTTVEKLLCLVAIDISYTLSICGITPSEEIEIGLDIRTPAKTEGEGIGTWDGVFRIEKPSRFCMLIVSCHLGCHAHAIIDHSTSARLGL